jgi:hypothetical protein
MDAVTRPFSIPRPLSGFYSGFWLTLLAASLLWLGASPALAASISVGVKVRFVDTGASVKTSLENSQVSLQATTPARVQISLNPTTTTDDRIAVITEAQTLIDLTQSANTSVGTHTESTHGSDHDWDIAITYF